MYVNIYMILLLWPYKKQYASNSSWKYTLGEKRTNEQEQILTADS